MNLRRDLRFDPFSEEARQLIARPSFAGHRLVFIQIFTSYDLLKGILERHEATIQKRWTKRLVSRDFRLLLKAWPPFQPLTRPDFEAFRKEPKEEREKGTKFKDHFMWPYVNQEDLSQSKLMLLSSQARALLILEAQARLMSFLIDCCRQILHEILRRILPAIRIAMPLDFPLWQSWLPKLLIDYQQSSTSIGLSSLLEARKLAAEDHVWSLREDPAYFADQFREIQDHRQEMIPDTQGKPHPATQKLRENTLWARLKNLGHLQKKFEKKIQATNELPEEYMVALLRFKYYLEQASKAPLEKLKVSVTASPPMRKFFVREPPPDPNTTKILIRTRPGVNMDKAETELIWLLRTLWEDDYALFLARPPIVVDELERLLQAEPKADALISAHVAKIIGELAILTQCQKQLELYQPWAQQFDMASADHVDGFEKEFTALQKPMTQLHGAFLQKHLDSAARVGEPSGGKFTYPYGKRRTKETVDALRQAEANLDMFWAKVDDVTKARVMDFEGTALYRLLSQPRILRRTAQWVEPAKKSERVEPSLEKDIWALNQPMSNLFLGQSEKMGQDPSSRSVQSKTKVKTKGVDNQPTFAVDARVLKVFRTLFFNPEVTSTPGSVPWHDFLYSMASTGFRIEKLYGSVWQFSPTSLDVERSIHFHEPHPRVRFLLRLLDAMDED
ncbi:hypothetical protein BKA59DRAFT_488931 [Fusarium tricinctum]|uniref:Uncharacterized protein n=1 Tax=Fusarium tricinctum TaxID=61284 RepID=A0A8K0RMW7_9HYPO|nr:hypothetical protein BKA59DRAFT_488931 [Fusarium tricinctum]